MRLDFRGRQVGPALIDRLRTNLLALGIRTLQTEVAWQSPELIAFFHYEPVLRQARWLKTTWDLASLYLASFHAELLSDDAPHLLGLSEETSRYVSVEYFTGSDRFADFVVHEAAHVFHNCKRRTVGLPSTRRREWILDIDFAKREAFAYACEAYSRILELGDGPTARRALLSDLEREPLPSADRANGGEYLDVLREAVTRRNGWKRILARCAPPRRRLNAGA